MGTVHSLEMEWEERFRMQGKADLERACDLCNDEQYLEALWIIEMWTPVCVDVWRRQAKLYKHRPSVGQHTALTLLNGFGELREFFHSEIEVALHSLESDLMHTKAWS